MKKLSWLLVMFLGIFPCLNAQEPVLEEYIKLGLEKNLALQQKQADYEISLKALQSAGGLFYPNLGIDARYTVARGGRMIDFPVGDLLNPVYSTLNQLLQANQFPQVENQEFPFYRPTEQETKLTLVQPVFNPSILYNYQINKVKTHVAEIDVEIYKRELILQIKTAYYNYLKTVHLLDLVDETINLLEENLRVSKSLFENDKVTSDVVYLSDAQLKQAWVSRAEAEKSNQTARAYFNFLLNRPLNDEIQVPDSSNMSDLPIPVDVDNYINLGIGSREEIMQLGNYLDMNEKYLKLKRSSNYPNLFVALNYGFQGEEYSFTANDDFMLASVVLQWNLFQGFKNQADIQQAKITQNQLELKQQEVQHQVELQVINTFYELKAAAKTVEASQAQVEASNKAFKIVREKYRNGQASLIEFTDARTQMTTSRQNLIIASFDYRIREADFERVTASATLQ